MDSQLNQLPVLRTFLSLKRGDVVYSKTFGLGEVVSKYQEDEVIVQFGMNRKRISVLDEELSFLPPNPKVRNKVEVLVLGEKISFAEFKRRRKLERMREKNEALLNKELARKKAGKK